MRVGIGAQLGWGKETTYGTGVTATKFLPPTSIGLKKVKTVVQGSGLDGQFLNRASQRAAVLFSAAGPIAMQVFNKDMGQWIQALMGTTVTPVQQASTTAYLQTHTMADPYGKSLTIQAGIPEVSTGTVRPYTFLGCKILGAEFTAVPGELLTVSFDVDAQNVTEVTSLASASYSSGLVPFSGLQTDIKIGTFGSEAHVDGVSQVVANLTRPSKVDRNYLGNAGLKDEPLVNSKNDAFTGTITADYLDKTVFADLFSADTPTSIVIESVGAVIASTYHYTFRLTLPDCYLNDGAPTVEGPDVVSGDFPFTCLYDGTNQPKIEIIETASSI